MQDDKTQRSEIRGDLSRNDQQMQSSFKSP